MKLYEEKYVVIDYDPTKKILTQTWKGFARPEEFRKAIDKTVEFALTYNFVSLISNTQDFALVKKEDTDYAAAVVPRLMRNGMKFMAFVLPKSVFTKQSVGNFTKETPPDFIKHFDSIESAIGWLDEKNKA